MNPFLDRSHKIKDLCMTLGINEGFLARHKKDNPITKIVDGVEFKTIGQSLLSGSFTLLHLESGQYFPFEVPGGHLIIKWKHKYE